MKTLGKFIFYIATTFFSIAAHAQDLFFSEYIEGSSNNKALEIYNGTSSPVDLNAGQYVIQCYSNANTTPGTAIKLNGIIQPGKVFVFVHNAFSLTVPAGTINQKDTTVSLNWYNGNDAVMLRKGGASGTIVDVIGKIGENPTTWSGSGLTTTDRTLIRKSSITHGDAAGTDTFDPSLEWDGLPKDDVSNLGIHNAVVITETIQITPRKLAFNLSHLTDTLTPKSYTVSGNAKATLLSINAGGGFKISFDSSGIYTSALQKTTDSASYAKGIKLFIRFIPVNTDVVTGAVTHTIGAVSASLPVQGAVTTTVNPISAIQGNSKQSPLLGQNVVIEGIVTADLQLANQQKGFYVQDIFRSDNDSLSSEGIFVYDNLSGYEVEENDRVVVYGTVAETFSQTQIVSVSAVSVVSKKNTVLPVLVKLPLDSVNALERFEGMKIKVNQLLTVTETYKLGRYGELTASVNGRLFNPTNIIDVNDNPKEGLNSSGTSNLASVVAQQSLNDRSKVLICDKLSVQNPNPVPFIDPVSKTIRSGSTIDTLTGVMGYDFGDYRIYPAAGHPKFNYAPRPQLPVSLPADIRIVGMNVLNYFNGDGNGGGFPTPRGAATLKEFRRQRGKLVTAMRAMDADIYGLMEMENDGDGNLSAIKNLVDTLNTAYGSPVYDYVRDHSGANGNPGSDQIKVAIIYKVAAVTPAGLAVSHNDAAFDLLGRPPLAQTFTVNKNAEKFTVLVNHFKSKGCAATPADLKDNDMLDGQGCFNATRKKQTTALLSFITSMIQKAGDPDIITLGDYNAYEQEDPIDMLKAGGLISLKENTYSYVFNGQSGSLDHAFVSAAMKQNLVEAEKWHINADEPTAIDYTLTFKTEDLFSYTPYRYSDHDPIIATFKWEGIITSGESVILNAENTYHIFPNPTQGETIHFTKELTGTIFNSYAGVVSAFHNTNQINVSNWVPGMYYIVAEGYNVQKFIIIH